MGAEGQGQVPFRSVALLYAYNRHQRVWRIGVEGGVDDDIGGAGLYPGEMCPAT